MFKIELSMPLAGPAGKFPLLPSQEFEPNPDRKRVRHLLIGLPADVQGVVDRLHLCGYCDRDDWSRTTPIPEGGILILPDPGDALRYLERWRSLK